MKIESLFVSDVHLGWGDSKTKKFLTLINEVECKNIFIVGDFIDGWVIEKKRKWIDDNNAIIQKLLSLSRKGTKIYYMWGNHDDFLSKSNKLEFGENIKICRTKIYKALNGKKYLLIHGDQFDGFLRLKCFLPVQKFGSFLYERLSWFNEKINKMADRLGLREKYVPIFLKPKPYLSDFPEMAVQEADRQKCEGVICGHLHAPSHVFLEKIEYLNCGDWLKSCTYITETIEGEFKLKRFEWENPKVSVDSYSP